MQAKLLPLVLLTASATAQDFDFVIDPSMSPSSMTASVQSVLPGSVIGAYDSVNNPGGTRTVNGLFGGGTNETVALTTTVDNTSSMNGSVSGSFGMSIDTNTNTGSISNLDADMLSGSTGNSQFDLTLLFNTFRTFNPDSLYVGGIPVTIPLPPVTVLSATFTQNAPTNGGTLGPPAGGSDFTFYIVVPVDVNLVVDYNGQTIPVGPVAITLSVNGTLTYTSTGMRATASFSGYSQGSVNDPFPGFQIDDQPLDLPTILPPGNTANLLLDATIASMTHDVQLDVYLEGDGTPSNCGFTPYCDANPNSTGVPSVITANGSTDVADKDLTLSVTSLPTNKFGYFIMAQTQAYIPLFGGSQGNLCLGSPLLRFAKNILNSGNAGSVTFSPDFDNLPMDTVFTAGSTWNFQLWHRDIAGMSNTTAGMSVQFCN